MDRDSNSRFFIYLCWFRSYAVTFESPLRTHTRLRPHRIVKFWAQDSTYVSYDKQRSKVAVVQAIQFSIKQNEKILTNKVYTVRAQQVKRVTGEQVNLEVLLKNKTFRLFEQIVCKSKQKNNLSSYPCYSS